MLIRPVVSFRFQIRTRRDLRLIRVVSIPDGFKCVTDGRILDEQVPAKFIFRKVGYVNLYNWKGYLKR
jgi:hypothetical protein